MITRMVLILLVSSSVLAQSQDNPVYPIVKFKKEKLKLWEYPEAKNSIKIKVAELGEPEKVAVIGFAGGSNEHLVINYQDQDYSFSRSKVVLEPDFDKRTATGITCTESNLGKNEQRAETTSVCER